MGTGIWQTVVVFFLMVAVLFGAYYVTKFLAKRGKRLTRSKYIKVVDQIYIAADKQIALIDVAGEKLLIGVTNQAINLISKIDGQKIDEDFISQGSAQPMQGDFLGKVADFINRAKSSPSDLHEMRKKAKSQKTSAKSETKETDENFDAILKSIEDKKRQFDSYREDGRKDDF